jgi:hypothetical protein
VLSIAMATSTGWLRMAQDCLEVIVKLIPTIAGISFRSMALVLIDRNTPFTHKPAALVDI